MAAYDPAGSFKLISSVQQSEASAPNFNKIAIKLILVWVATDKPTDGHAQFDFYGDGTLQTPGQN